MEENKTIPTTGQEVNQSVCARIPQGGMPWRKEEERRKRRERRETQEEKEKEERGKGQPSVWPKNHTTWAFVHPWIRPVRPAIRSSAFNGFCQSDFACFRFVAGSWLTFLTFSSSLWVRCEFQLPDRGCARSRTTTRRPPEVMHPWYASSGSCLRRADDLIN